MDCVIFDFDGTIANTVPLCVEALRRAVQNLTGRKPTAAEIESTFGPSEEGTLAAFAPGRTDEGMEIYLGIYRELHPVLCPAPFGGLEQVFSFLREKGVKTALVTGKSAPRSPSTSNSSVCGICSAISKRATPPARINPFASPARFRAWAFSPKTPCMSATP